MIFRDTLRRDFGHDPELLRDQVTRTVRHELAHHVGFDELGVSRLDSVAAAIEPGELPGSVRRRRAPSGPAPRTHVRARICDGSPTAPRGRVARPPTKEMIPDA